MFAIEVSDVVGRAVELDEVIFEYFDGVEPCVGNSFEFFGEGAAEADCRNGRLDGETHVCIS